MSYKGMRGATLKYMNSIDKQSKSLRRNIKNIKKDIESSEHILYISSTNFTLFSNSDSLSVIIQIP